VSFGEYGLFWSGSTPPTLSPPPSRHSRKDANGPPPRQPQPRQYVFSARSNSEEPLFSSLRRAETFPDVLEALLGRSIASSNVGSALVIVAFALGGGNLLATGRWITFVVCLSALAVVAVFEMKGSACLVCVAMVVFFTSTVLMGDTSVQWLATEAFVSLAALTILAMVLQMVQVDPRGHVMLREPCDVATEEVVIKNDCCMDVKLLLFDGTDICRLVPKGGLLGGVLISRGSSHMLGTKPPYFVKFYAPWERELGGFQVSGGKYSLRETAPALALSTSESPCFTNGSDEHVAVCFCSTECWTCSLWLPLAPLLARLVGWPVSHVAPQESIKLSTPCMLRVYSTGLLGALFQRANAVVREQESAEYLGSIQWTHPPSKVRKSTSSLIKVVH